MSDPTPRGEAGKSKWADPAIRKRIIEGQRRYWEENPEARKQRGKIAKLALASPEVRQRISEGSKRGLYRLNITRAFMNSGVPASESHPLGWKP
jgi:hypothetical protein